MTMCSVLRCYEPGTARVPYSRPGAALMEAPVCAAHHAQIEAGKPWQWHDDDRAIVMDADLDSGGELILAGQPGLVEDLGRTVLTLEVKTPSGGEHGPIKLVLPKEAFGPLTDFLNSMYLK